MLEYENEAQLFQIFLDLNILDYEYINSPLILFAITNIDTLEKMQPKFRKSQLADWEGEISSIISPQVCLLQNIFSISQHMPHLCIPLLWKASKNGNGGFCVLQSTSALNVSRRGFNLRQDQTAYVGCLVSLQWWTTFQLFLCLKFHLSKLGRICN